MLISPTELKILEILLYGGLSVKEVAYKLSMSSPAASKHLTEMAGKNLLIKESRKTNAGKEVIYRPNRFTFFFSLDPSCGLVQIKINSEFDIINILLEQIKDEEFKLDLLSLLERINKLSKTERPEYIILFGSVAESKGTWKSDIDIALLKPEWYENTKKRLSDIISEVSMNTKHQIKPKFFTFLEIENGNSLIIIEIRRNGLIIYGKLFGRSLLWKSMEKYRSI